MTTVTEIKIACNRKITEHKDCVIRCHASAMG